MSTLICKKNTNKCKFTTNIGILMGKYRLKPLIQSGLSHFFTKIQLICKNITNNPNELKTPLPMAFDCVFNKA